MKEMVSPAMPPPLQVFSTKPPSSSSSSTLSLVKIKTLIHTLIISHVCRMVRALSKAKTILVQILKENHPMSLLYPTKDQRRKHRQRKIFFGSFRLHYNWCSSHVLPVPAPHLYYDSTWNSIIGDDNNNSTTESQLSGYLHWLEEKVQENNNSSGSSNGEENGGVNEIDELADMFIASCHEKFMLEKQESYRRFQEMMARSV